MSDPPPLVHELPPRLAAVDVFDRLSTQPHCVFFDSANSGERLARYSYVAADPYAWLTAQADGTDGLRQLAEQMPFGAKTIENLPPFQGGAAGVLSYELGRSLEKVPAARHDEFQSPAMAVGLYDVVVAFDHAADRAWIVSTGRGPGGQEPCLQRAEQRFARMRGLIEAPPGAGTTRPATEPAGFPDSSRSEPDRPGPRPNALDASPLAPQHPVEALSNATSDFSRDGYLAAVRRAVDYIHAGDIFQVNLSQRLLAKQIRPSEQVYLQLRQRNPAPFAGYADLGDVQVASASPERFLSVRDGCVETRPIKGTRPRSIDPTHDAQLAADLVEHPKDRAENIMIVDLLRNDLSRVCTPDSVRVPTLCGLESYRHVHHLVSVVEGRLSPGRTPIDLLRATFPGGSITGAPKVRAMEIIAELEPTARGPYCGSLFWAGFNGAMDSSILIRTAVCAGGWIQTSVGGGIVADSDPASEYEETLHKAKGMVEGLRTGH